MTRELYYREAGKGQTIVFLHGILGSSLYWREHMDVLKDNYRVVALDLLGFGRSPKPENIAYSRDDHLDYIVSTLDKIGVDKPTIVVGHSMGAILALSFAVRHPERVSRLILISMPIYKNSAEAKREITRSKIVPRLMYYGSTARLICAVMCKLRALARLLIPLYFKHLPKDIAAEATRHTWYSYSRSMENVIENQNVLGELQKVKVPVVALFGTRDRVARHSKLEALQLCCTEVKVTLLNATHHVAIEAPKRTAQIISGKTD